MRDFSFYAWLNVCILDFCSCCCCCEQVGVHFAVLIGLFGVPVFTVHDLFRVGFMYTVRVYATIKASFILSCS